MVRRSMVLLMVLLAAAFIAPNSALAAKDGGSSFRAKAFVLDNNTPTTSNSVSATFTCSGDPLSVSGSFFYQLADGRSVYGDINTDVPCELLTSGSAAGTWSSTQSAPNVIGPITAPVTVESVLGMDTPGNLILQFQNAKNGHNFSQPILPCPISTIDLCVSLSLTFDSPISGVLPFPVNEEKSASLLLSVRG
jgi:hypothetical protein